VSFRRHAGARASNFATRNGTAYDGGAASDIRDDEWNDKSIESFILRRSPEQSIQRDDCP